MGFKHMTKLSQRNGLPREAGRFYLPLRDLIFNAQKMPPLTGLGILSLLYYKYVAPTALAFGHQVSGGAYQSPIRGDIYVECSPKKEEAPLGAAYSNTSSQKSRRALPWLTRYLLLSICFFIPFISQAANFTASLDRDTITLGESATLSLTFEGGQPGNVPTPDVPGLQIVSTGNSSSVSFNNGNNQMSSVFTVTFSVTPQQTGTFTIPGMVADIGGQQIRTDPIKLTVVQASGPTAAQINSGSQVAFMRLSLPRKKVYPGQLISGQLQLCFRDDVQQEANFQITSLPANGFTIGKFVQGGTERAQIGSRVYKVIPFSIALAATKTGALSVGPISASVVLMMNNGGGWGPFGGFFGEQKQVMLTADSVTADSFPLPAQNVPANFTGAVGDYSMIVSAGPTNVAVGDPVTVRVEITGRGAVDSVQLPDQTGWSHFKIFSPTSKTRLDDDLGDAGAKTFEEIVTPENADVRELPPFSFSFFNPDDGNYHTLTQPAMPLAVRSAGATPLPTITAGARQPESQAPQDIVPIRQNLGTPAAAAAIPFIARPSFIALQSVPVLAFFAALVWRKRTDHLANHPRLRRQRAVAQIVAAGLEDLNQFAIQNKAPEFFAMLFRLLQEQLGERLDCPAISITEADVDERLVRMGARPETVEALRELFQACNQARYAQVQTSQELSALVSKFKKTAGDLQQLKA